MDESLPFLPDPAPPGRDGPVRDPAPPDLAAAAQRMATEVDRRLAREQPAPTLAPIRRTPEPPPLAGSVPLPFYSSLHDPARVSGARHREMRAFRPRVVECVACEYPKLENRLGDPAAHGLDRARLTSDQLQHFGPGERNYTVCQTCHDTSGKIHPLVYPAWPASATARPRSGASATTPPSPRSRTASRQWTPGAGASAATSISPGTWPGPGSRQPGRG